MSSDRQDGLPIPGVVGVFVVGLAVLAFGVGPALNQMNDFKLSEDCSEGFMERNQVLMEERRLLWMEVDKLEAEVGRLTEALESCHGAPVAKVP